MNFVVHFLSCEYMYESDLHGAQVPLDYLDPSYTSSYVSVFTHSV